MRFELDESVDRGAKIKVIGIGGAGGNAVNGMINANLQGVEFVSTNTDLQALKANKANVKVQIGKNLTKGLGAGANPEIGYKAIEEDRDAMVSCLANVNMAFVTCGLGGGTGTGAAPVIAEIAKEMGILTVAIVTKPFLFEGPRRMRVAEEGLSRLKEKVDTMIVIPNQRLLSICSKDTSLNEAFKMADDILYQATKGISDLINVPGLINLDFADVKTIMTDMGDAIMGTGVGLGENKAQEAAQHAISSPLLEEISVEGAKGVLVNITGGKNLSLYQVNDATSIIFETAGPEANIIFGAVIDQNSDDEDEVRVTVIATGFNKKQKTVEKIEEKYNNIINTSNKERDKPAYKRISKSKLETVSMENENSYPFDTDDLDIPAFLRKQMD
ncbi:cell division protein FtsZ [candidate division KSB1 bacterium]